MLQTAVNTQNIPETFEKFIKLVGSHHWTTRATYVNQQATRNSFLGPLLREEYATALALTACSAIRAKRGELVLSTNELAIFYSAITLVTNTVSVTQAMSSVDATRFVKRVRGAIKDPEAMRALHLELTTATHFLRKGVNVVWPEIDGIGTFDLLLTTLGPCGLEVECKAISWNKGRKIWRKEAAEFYHQIYAQIRRIGETIIGGLTVVMTVPDRLPTSNEHRKALGSTLINQILIGKSELLQGGIDIRIEPFDIAMLPSVTSPIVDPVAKLQIDKLTNTRNRESLVVGRRNQGAIIFVLQSAKTDATLSAMFDTLSDSAKTQLSKTRPAIYAVELQGISYDALIATGEQDKNPEQPKTALSHAVSKFLSSTDRDHVVGVAFLSGGQKTVHEQNTSSAVTSAMGSVYYFPKKSGSLWHQDFSGLFGSITSESSI
ncbi:MAG: hypothetical protein ABL985_16315 [Casimicrobium sp.]